MNAGMTDWDWNFVIALVNVLEFVAIVLPICGLCLCGTLMVFPGLRNVSFSMRGSNTQSGHEMPVLPLGPSNVSFA